MKKIISVIASFVFIIIGAVSLNGCNSSEENEKVMNISTNPQVEFILNHNNEVVSVNALNEEGNVVISADVSYVGKTATHAAQLFIEATKETGYLVSGRAGNGENEIKVSISGDRKQAEELYNKIEVEVRHKFEELNLSATISNAGCLTDEYIESKLRECCPYLSHKEIEKMTYEELILKLKESRDETKDFYSQQLKAAYYEAKEDAYNKAKVDCVKSQLGVASRIAVDLVQATYETAIANLETARKNHLLKADCDYQEALADFNAKKIAYLKKRNEVSEMAENEVTVQIQNDLTLLKTAVETAQNVLTLAFNTANAAIDTVKEVLTGAYNVVVTTIKNINSTLYDALDLTNQTIVTALTTFHDGFVSGYDAFKTNAKNIADNMRNQLKVAE